MSEYLAIAQEAARKAANVTLDYYTRKLTVSIKKDRTPVTDADHAAEKTIIDIIKSKFSNKDPSKMDLQIIIATLNAEQLKQTNKILKNHIRHEEKTSLELLRLLRLIYDKT